MRNDDDGTDRPEESEGQRTRDNRGRWVKGFCPNRKGRPKKKRMRNLDPTDLRWFANTLIEVQKEGKPKLMTRKEILYERMFESAVKDRKVSRQKFLFEKFYENDKNIAELSVRFQDLVYYWLTANPDRDKPGYEIPEDVIIEINQLRDLLDHYYHLSSGSDEI